MAIINEKILKETADMIKGVLMDNGEEIDKAYCADDGKLPISLNVKYDRSSDGSVKIRANMNFVKERVKKSVDRTINPHQRMLFEEEDI